MYTHCIQNPMNLYTRCVQCTHTPYAKFFTVSERKFDRLHRPASSSSLNFKKIAGDGTAFCLNDIWFSLVIRQKAVLLPANGFKIQEKSTIFVMHQPTKTGKNRPHVQLLVYTVYKQRTYSVHTVCTHANNRTTLGRVPYDGIAWLECTMHLE